jgi:nicotinate-nucleotide adenylyltransferase
MRLGILGGSFDPVHLGHVALAEAARDRLRLDRVLLIVAAGQPLKPGGPAASGEDRYAMLRLAVRGRPRLEASDLELRRPAPSWTVETLREVRLRHPDATEVLLLLGADALADFPRWREVDAIRALARVVACPRPSAGTPGTPALAGADEVLDARTPEVSSSEVRRRAAAGEPFGDLVPADVEEYIRERGLYGVRG